MNTIEQIISKIIKEQELIVGPMALEEAKKVKGLSINNSDKVVIENTNQREVVDGLVKQYESMFGRASREVCKDAAASLIADLAPSEVPSTLQ